MAPDSFHVLIVCTGNTCRSPMAEVALRKLVAHSGMDAITVSSAGTSGGTGFPATTFAVEAVKMWELDLNEHESTALTKELIERADVTLVMTGRHHRHAFSLAPDSEGNVYLLKEYPDTNPEGGEIDDPIGCSLDVYNSVFLEIGEELGRILPILITKAQEKLKV
ncbi:MAG: low molecular weight protein arginine phosphatase [candidate division Zixibacteria bacterium]|nr:low molecular weight protein arginine phosphatase [candidate division Zixibacteria bacterium]